MSKIKQLSTAFEQWWDNQREGWMRDGILLSPNDCARRGFVEGYALRANEHAAALAAGKQDTEILDYMLDHGIGYGTGEGQTFAIFLPDHEDVKCAVVKAMKEGWAYKKANWKALESLWHKPLPEPQPRDQKPSTTKETAMVDLESYLTMRARADNLQAELRAAEEALSQIALAAARRITHS